jgi:2-hydroxy-3-oxopropionate reductase
MKIGFIGLGIMGKPMAANLVKAGHDVLAYDLVQENVNAAVGLGVSAASGVTEIAKTCGTVITMLPNSPHVREVALGAGGILENAAPGTLLIDMSSIAPGVSQEVEAALAVRGIKMIDAPVSGGEPKAIDGTLAIMAGGDRDIFESVKDSVLLKMGASAVWCGAIGAGNTTKLANQVIVACNIAALSEALTLSRKAGVEPSLVFEAIKGGLAGSTVMNAKTPMILENNFKPGFKIDLHIKDLANALETGHDAGSPMPLTAAVMEMLQVLKADGMGGYDHSALAEYYAKLSGERIGG